MRNRLFISFLLLLCLQQAFAGHIAGGELYYTWMGVGSAPDKDQYKITLRLFRDCTPSGSNVAQLPTSVRLGIFDRSNNSLVSTQTANQGSFQNITLSNPSPCIVNPRPVCYQVAEYSTTIELTRNAAGYTAAYQTCCRSNDIVNLVKYAIPGQPANQPPSEGTTYVADIPGTNTVAATDHNSSATFAIRDTVLICQDKNFKLDFSATDSDPEDSLSYSLCAAYNRGVATNSSDVTPSSPPYQEVGYVSPFAGTQPLGSSVSIDPNTGMISGRAPAAGVYVVNVCITEWRKGVAISTHRKDFSVKIASCDFAAVELPANAIQCDGFTSNFINNANSSQINSYLWDFGVASSTTDTSTQATPSYTYADTGVYTVKLVVNPGQQCSDSGYTTLKVFPGFTPAFSFDGSCYLSPFQFTDRSVSRYGTINNWRWDFGNTAVQNDTSRLRNPQYLFPAAGTYKVVLDVSDNKGCQDTTSLSVNVLDKPVLQLAFRDTLICSIDSLTLKAFGNGSFSWSPTTRIVNSNTATPIVFPKDTTVYTVILTDRNCTATDSVKVNVLDNISVDAGNDTVICRTDAIPLRPVSYGLGYQWTPTSTLNNPNIKYPIATPTAASTTYTVVANLGKCKASDQIIIRTVPYPVANAGKDTGICYNNIAILRGSTTAAYHQWSPAAFIQDPLQNSSPTLSLLQSTDFIFTVRDTLGCPKPAWDTVHIKVVPKIQVFAGNDTSVVYGQTLQFNARSNASIFNWSPAIGISNPSALQASLRIDAGVLPPGQDQQRYVLNVTTPEGCKDADDIIVFVFKTVPSIFIPSAFTPNGDGRNDMIKPILAGMKELLYFRVYNRYGQLVFETKQVGKGWDGNLKGTPQSSAAFVYDCRAIDYLGNPVEVNGTFTLIR